MSESLLPCDLCLDPAPTSNIRLTNIRVKRRSRIICTLCAVRIADLMIDNNYLKIYRAFAKARKKAVA